MREVFHQSLEDVQSRLVEIAELVTEAIDKATRAFGTSDVALAEEVIEADQTIDDKAVALDELAIQILARQQPVARDLRIVVAALRVSASLERMGDIAEHIAQLTRMRFPERAIPKGLKGTFTKMGELDVEVAKTLTELLRTEDLSYLETLRTLDDKVDDHHLAVFEKVLSEKLAGRGGSHRRCDPREPLPRALRRPRRLGGQEGRLPRHRRLDARHRHDRRHHRRGRIARRRRVRRRLRLGGGATRRGGCRSASPSHVRPVAGRQPLPWLATAAAPAAAASGSR